MYLTNLKIGVIGLNQKMIGSVVFTPNILKLGLVAILAAITCAILILALHRILARFTLAHPNARSSHSDPTPQGGGIAVIGASLFAMACAFIFAPELVDEPRRLLMLCGSVLGLAIVGATDDIHPLEAMPRIILQSVAAAVMLATLPAELRILPSLPWWIERACILLGCIWFINLVNFMDGIDWMTVAEVVPVTAGLTLLGLMGTIPQHAVATAAALFGAMIGFAPFNKPVARLFLGDVGSLPIGLMLSWILILMAGDGHFVAALLLPLYYLVDATLTLLRRLAKGKSVTQAHRDHFYQRAIDSGLNIYQIVGSVFAANIILVGLAVISVNNPSAEFQILTLMVGSAVVGGMLWKFNSSNHLRF
jgi:UDP-N-acetylmuramyl pentapeptide phosphotransferase/UDP-N-acetylglucosamine-1-phosphate transferase